jgi:hypothetical protein
MGLFAPGANFICISLEITPEEWLPATASAEAT